MRAILGSLILAIVAAAHAQGQAHPDKIARLINKAADLVTEEKYSSAKSALWAVAHDDFSHDAMPAAFSEGGALDNLTREDLNDWQEWANATLSYMYLHEKGVSYDRRTAERFALKAGERGYRNLIVVYLKAGNRSKAEKYKNLLEKSSICSTRTRVRVGGLEMIVDCTRR